MESKIIIFATDQKGNKEQIKDLYWFEENGVHDWNGDGSNGYHYKFQIIMEWNTRPIEDALRANLQIAKEALEWYRLNCEPGLEWMAIETLQKLEEK